MGIEIEEGLPGYADKNCVLLNVVKGHSQLWDRADLDTSFRTLKRVHPNPKSKYIWNAASIFTAFWLIYFWFTEKPVFECAFAHPMMLFLSYLVKNSMDRVPRICKLAVQWYQMRMCASWLCPFKLESASGSQTAQIWKYYVFNVENKSRLGCHATQMF